MLQVREKTNLEIDVYRQALSVVEEQLLPTRESTQYIAGHACLTHIHKPAYTFKAVHQLSYAQTCANLSSR